jgi:MSHA biogenesis protein MshO
MIIVIVITGIIGGIVAVFLRLPVQGYVDSARRAEMTDIADTALRRISRDLRIALPNSVRVRNAAGTPCVAAGAACYLEFIPTIGGGRYRDSTGGAGTNPLLFTAADASFDVLGAMPPGLVVGDQIVVYNLGIPGADAYSGNTLATDVRRAISAAPVGGVISIVSANPLPFDSCVKNLNNGLVVGGCRFQVVQTPVTYACNPVAGTLTRWQGYPYPAPPAQPIAQPAGGTASLLAANVSACTFTYTPGGSQRTGMVTMHLTITVQGESVTLFSATHVNNVP